MSGAGPAVAYTEEQFYTDFVHCDVKKDHESGYNRDIVQGFLPPSSPGLSGPLPTKDGLFNRLVKIDGSPGDTYNFFRNMPDRSTGSISIQLFEKSKYNFKVFDRSGFSNPDIVRQIQAATLSTPGRILKITDTNMHTREIHNLWTQGTNPIIQANTRAVQMDAASKFNPTTVGNADMFYFESKPPSNPTSALYPAYESDNKLSHLYCKYPVYITHKGIERNKYSLKVGLEYYKDKLIQVDGNLNTAGFMFKIIEKAKACFGKGVGHDRLEAGFIAKHSGDVLMVLDRFRDIVLQRVDGTGQVNTSTLPYSIFETIDINATTKAFAVGIDCVWLHINGKLIVFTKVKDELEYSLTRANGLAKSVLEKMATLGGFRNEINTLISKVSTMITNFREYDVSGADYKAVLKNYTQYAILYERVPGLKKKLDSLNTLYNESYDAYEGDIKSVYETFMKAKGKYEEGNEPSKAQLTEACNSLISILEPIDRNISHFLGIKIETNLADHLMTDGILAPVHIKELVFLTKEDDITYSDVFDCIDISDKPRDLGRRVSASKTVSAWGLDIINKVYRILSKIDEDVNTEGAGGGGAGGGGAGGGGAGGGGGGGGAGGARDFINKLSLTTGDKLDKFRDLISSIGIKVPLVGGSRVYRKTYKKKSKVRRTYKQRGGAFNDEFVREIIEELSFLKSINTVTNTAAETQIIKNVFIQHFGILPSSQLATGQAGAGDAPEGLEGEAGAVPLSVEVVLDVLDTYADIAHFIGTEELKGIINTLIDIKDPDLSVEEAEARAAEEAARAARAAEEAARAAEEAGISSDPDNAILTQDRELRGNSDNNVHLEGSAPAKPYILVSGMGSTSRKSKRGVRVNVGIEGGTDEDEFQRPLSRSGFRPSNIRRKTSKLRANRRK